MTVPSLQNASEMLSLTTSVTNKPESLTIYILPLLLCQNYLASFQNAAGLKSRFIYDVKDRSSSVNGQAIRSNLDTILLVLQIAWKRQADIKELKALTESTRKTERRTKLKGKPTEKHKAKCIVWNIPEMIQSVLRIRTAFLKQIQQIRTE